MQVPFAEWRAEGVICPAVCLPCLGEVFAHARVDASIFHFAVDVIGEAEEFLLDVVAKSIEGRGVGFRVDPVGSERISVDAVEGSGTAVSSQLGM